MATTNNAPTDSMHGWSKEALVAKAQRMCEEMMRHPRDDWRFALWSTLALELLARAAVAQVSPTLLAEPRDWNNVYHALGFQPKVKKFVPRSIDISTVFDRLKDILPDLTGDLHEFGVVHMGRRNEELHSGKLPFDALASAGWLPLYYRTCEVLIKALGHDIDLLFGKAEADIARAMIAASLDESAKAVEKVIHAHKLSWEQTAEEDRVKLIQQASVWATRYDGHRVICPSCQCDALVTGDAIAAPLKSIDEDHITETQEYLPSKFECIACRLKISGLPQLAACGLGHPYTSTSVYDAAEYYRSNDPYSEYEDDNNEY